MKLYNTLTRQKEEFIPLEAGKVKMYSCGPTVYNYFHVGNARPFIIFDILRRYFEYRGYEVNFVQNFTDIDDKVIKRANEEGTTFDKIADKYIEEYYVDAKGLGVKEATAHPKATDCMDEIINIVQTLIDKDFAYVAEGDVYFRTKKFEGYGKLSGQPMEDLLAGARIDVDNRKEDPMDFAIWKAAKEGEPSWNTPWGNGRPGWHIECSAMVNKYLGKTIDIHSGGKDLTFPHHENEIAQSEACNDAPFANYWLHNGFLTIDNQKMSKSLNNFFMVREAAEVYGYEAIRMFMLSAHYRSPINYSEDSLKQSKAALERITTARQSLEFLCTNGAEGDLIEAEKTAIDGYKAYTEKFIAAMDDDINTADAVAVIFEMVREVNTFIKENSPTRTFAKATLKALDELCDVLGLVPQEQDNALDAEIEKLIEARTRAKKDKDFALADKIRDDLLARGIELKDTRQGVQWSRI